MPQTRSRARSATPQKDVPNNLSDHAKDVEASQLKLETVSENSVCASESPDGNMAQEDTNSTVDPSPNASKEESLNPACENSNDAAHGIIVENPSDHSKLTKSNDSASNVVELSCQVCNCSFTNYHEHMNSDAHKASMSSKSEKGNTGSSSPNSKLQAQKRGGQEPVHSSPPQKKPKISEGDQPNIFECDVCKIKVNRKQDFDLHLQGKRHNIAVQKAAGKAYCDCCYLFFNTHTELNEHLDSQLHKNNVAEKKTDSTKYFCDVCQFSSIGKKAKNQHIGSKWHKRLMQERRQGKDFHVISTPAAVNGKVEVNSEELKKKWLYVCNGCNYFTNDDRLMKRHMNQVDHKTAVAKMKQAGLLCGTPATVSAQPSKTSEVQAVSNSKSDGVGSSVSSTPSGACVKPTAAQSVVQKTGSGVSKAPAAPNTSTMSGSKALSSASVPSPVQSGLTSLGKKVETFKSPQGKKNPPRGQPALALTHMSSFGGNKFDNNFGAGAKRFMAGSFNVAAPPHISSMNIPKPLGYGPNMSSISYEHPPGSLVGAGNLNFERPRLDDDLRGNFRRDSLQPYESDFGSRLRAERGSRDAFYLDGVSKDLHRNIPGDLDSSIRRDFRGGINSEVLNSHANLKKDILGDLRGDLRGEFGIRRDLRDWHGDFPGDARGDWRNDARLDSRRESLADFRPSVGIGDLLRNDRQREFRGDDRSYGRMELPRENLDDIYRTRNIPPRFPDSLGQSYGDGSDGRSLPGPPMGPRSVGFMPGGRDTLGSGDYNSRFGGPRSAGFFGSMPLGGR